jgi:capsular polysaccharide transport system permease protein
MHSSTDLSMVAADAPMNPFLKTLHRRRWFILFVIVPTILATIYYGLFASDVYQAESRFVIKMPSQKQAPTSTIANLIQSSGVSSGHDQALEVMDYISSRDALKDLQSKINVRRIFSNQDADWISRYPGPFTPDSFESIYKYYKKMVDVNIDHDSNLMVLTVKSFSSKDAQDLNLNLLELSEGLVNRLNGRAQAKAIAEAESRVEHAQLRVRDARLRLREYRNSRDVMDPTTEATGVLEISNKLIGEQALLRAQLATMQRVAPQNPAIPALQGRINAIGGQIAAQTSRAVGTDNGLASKLTQYESLQVEQEFATQMLTMAGATLEQARSEALKQQYYLQHIVEPNRPDVAAYPKRIQSILVVAAAAFVLYLIGWMLIVGILEHSPED